jgi:hypothetical protein
MKNEKLKGALTKFNAQVDRISLNNGLEVIHDKDAMKLKGGYAPASDCGGFSCKGYAIACGAY